MPLASVNPQGMYWFAKPEGKSAKMSESQSRMEDLSIFTKCYISYKGNPRYEGDPRPVQGSDKLQIRGNDNPGDETDLPGIYFINLELPFGVVALVSLDQEAACGFGSGRHTQHNSTQAFISLCMSPSPIIG
eukprot:sb/3474992/